VNDLIIKKRYRPDFKKLVMDDEKSTIEKLELLNDEYRDEFEVISDLLEEKDL
jgi:hypothetical protein